MFTIFITGSPFLYSALSESFRYSWGYKIDRTFSPTLSGKFVRSLLDATSDSISLHMGYMCGIYFQLLFLQSLDRMATKALSMFAIQEELSIDPNILTIYTFNLHLHSNFYLGYCVSKLECKQHDCIFIIVIVIQ